MTTQQVHEWNGKDWSSVNLSGLDNDIPDDSPVCSDNESIHSLASISAIE